MTCNQLLLIRSRQPENLYGRFTLEILKSQGLNGFTLHDIDAAGMPALGTDDLAVLTRCLLTREEAGALREAVERGLRLICLQPPWNLVQRFGWTLTNRAMHPGWIAIDGAYPGGGTPLQTHVPITLFEPPAAGVTAVAAAVDSDWRASGFLAVARQSVGAGGVVHFFYDLPRAIARIRFGDPELASLLNSGMWSTLHACDLFEGHVDERVLHLPQADLQAQLLARVLTDVSPCPLARLWYFERPEHRAAANFSSDDDWSTPEQFRDLSESLLRHGGKGTFYLVRDTLLPDAEVRRMRDRGHSFGPHVDAMSPAPIDREIGLSKTGEWFINEDWPFDFPRRLREETAAFERRYATRSVSLQCHGAPWRGYMAWAPAFVENGYRLIYNYFHTKWLNRFVCGAGLPLKMVDEHGVLHDLWQQPLLALDDASIMKRIGENLEEVVQEFEAALRPIIERFHVAIGIASHPVSFSTYSKPYLEACFARLRAEGVPIYSGDEWCRFLDRRHAVRMRQSVTPGGELEVTLSDLAGPMTLMLPLGARGAGPRTGGGLDGGCTIDARSQVLVNGRTAEGQVHRRLGQDYLFLFIAVDGGDGASASEVTVTIGPADAAPALHAP